MSLEQKIDSLLQKIESTKKGEKLDLSLDEDLSIAIMNLVSIEEHFFFTGAKTNKEKYFDLLQETREIRKELLKKIVKEPEEEIWCISKHLLAATMRLIEVGAKSKAKGNTEEAKDFFQKAYRLYSLFWAVNLKLIEPGEIKKIDGKALNIHDETKTGASDKFQELLKKLLDCCDE